MTTINELANEIVDREIVSSRVIKAPVEEVFNAWTDPAKIINWWGPKGFTNTFHEFNPGPGGKWSFIMHGPDGTSYPNESVFISITKNTEIILDHISHPKFRLTATFAEHSDGTKLTFHMLFETAKIRDNVSKIAVQGNEENFDRLEELLRRISEK